MTAPAKKLELQTPIPKAIVTLMNNKIFVRIGDMVFGLPLTMSSAARIRKMLEGEKS